jgi:serine/threonine-protein kinase HipA
MNRCPITYDPMADTQVYSEKGLKLIHRGLNSLAPLAYSAEQQRQEAINRAGKMSIQGLQPKLSAVLRVSEGRFEIVDRGGRYILKPQSVDYPELPENEDLTMRMANSARIEVPLHALLRSSDGSLTYFIQRFDREGRTRVPLEDFAQLRACRTFKAQVLIKPRARWNGCILTRSAAARGQINGARFLAGKRQG